VPSILSANHIAGGANLSRYAVRMFDYDVAISFVA
jgi:hypothetical protein